MVTQAVQEPEEDVDPELKFQIEDYIENIPFAGPEQI